MQLKISFSVFIEHLQSYSRWRLAEHLLNTLYLTLRVGEEMLGKNNANGIFIILHNIPVYENCNEGNIGGQCLWC